MIDENTYLKHGTICKKCHNENTRKDNDNTCRSTPARHAANPYHK